MSAEEPTLAERIAAASAKRAAREAARPRKHPQDRRWDSDPASGWLEGDDFETPPPGRREPEEDRDRRRRVYSRQVGIRLSPTQYDQLSRSADLYGVAPTTMARMLVARGSRAVIDTRRRYDLEQGSSD